MKNSPESLDNAAPKRLSKNKSEQKVNQIILEIESDRMDRSEFMQRQAHYYRRRYVRENRRVDYPWPGASDIVMPVIDMTIDRLKAVLARVLLSRPILDFTDKSPKGYNRMNADKQFMQWRLSMNDFIRQSHFAFDELLQTGTGIFKVFWDYRTELVNQVVRSEHLPEGLKALLRPNPNDSLAAIDRGGVIPPTPGEIEAAIDRNLPAIRQNIADAFDLDPEDKNEKASIEAVVNLLKGKTKTAKIKKRKIVSNGSRAESIEHEKFIVPSFATDIQCSPRITHEIYLTETEFKQRARDQKWSKSGVKEVLDQKANRQDTAKTTTFSSNTDETIDLDRDRREGISGSKSEDLIRIYEHYRWESLNEGDDPERVVYYIHPGTSTLLKDPQGLFYNHGMFPFVDLRFELNDKRFYSSRGVPEKIDDIDNEITQRHRAKLNKMELLVPTYKYKHGRILNPDQFQFKPGGMFPVFGMDDIEPMPVPDYTFPEEREENTLSTYVMNYMGAQNTGISDQGNIHEARTATEIETASKVANEILSSRLSIIQDGMRRVFNMMWMLENQWAPARTYKAVTGADIQRLTQVQVEQRADVAPVGNLDSTDKNVAERKALQRLEAMMKLYEMGGQQVVGVKYEMNIGEAFKSWLDKSDENESKIVFRERTPEEIQAIQEQIKAKQELQQRVEDNTGITVNEAAEVAKQAGKASGHGKRLKILAPEEG